MESIALAEDAVGMINDLGVFTTNEHVDEVPTNELRYLLLPALLGQLMMKRTNSEDSFEAMQKAQIYLIDFIRLLRLYGITTVDLPKRFTVADASKGGTDEELETQTSTTKSASSTNRMAELEVDQRRRQEKIERFRRQKRLQEDLVELYAEVKQTHVDEEVKRKYYLTLLDKWLLETLDSLDGLNTELNLLHEMSKLKGVGDKEERNKSAADKSHHHHKHDVSHKPTKTLRPFIITKDDVQKKVFGLGYPGVPTFSVDEFYQQRVEQGIFPDNTHGAGPVAPKNHDEELEKQREQSAVKKEENHDDDESLRQARNWDDWRDDHRRGWGNTHNKG